jgi:hypothetical protein
MMRPTGKSPDGGQRNRLPVAAALTLVALIILTGCINIVPFPRRGEKREAIALAKVLIRLAPDAKALLLDEHKWANELKIEMDESGDRVGAAGSREKFTAYIDRLIGIRNKRQQIRDTVGQGVYESPMVFVVQHDAIVVLNDELARTQTWLQFAQNLRLRADMGRNKAFPELPILTAQLDGFLNQTSEDPLYTQVRALQEEYRFGEGEIAP